MEIRTKSAKETENIARKLALEAVRAKNQTSALVIALSGALGAGKTTFAQGFAQTLGIKERVLSPTFVLMKIYEIQKRARPRHFVHIDCYRIRSARDIIPLGVKEIFKDTKAIVLIEWPERIRGLIPRNALWIRLKHGEKENERILSFTPSLKFRQPQSVPSGIGKHSVLESSVFPPALPGRQKNQSKFSVGFTQK